MTKQNKWTESISVRDGRSLLLLTLALFVFTGCPGQPAANTTNSTSSTSPAPASSTSPDNGPQNPDQAEVIAAAKVATSTEPLLGMAPPTVNLAGGRKKKQIHLNPNVLVSLGPAKADPVLQSAAAAAPPSAKPTVGKNISGLGGKFKGPQGDFQMESTPPDTSGAVGETQFVQWVNDSFAVFNKATGAVEFGPVPGNTLFKALGGNCAKDNDGDPVVVFDKFARRWVLAQFSVSSGFSQCVAVSTSPDATGTYHLYEFTYPAFDDYPKIGVWPDGYYVTFNMFNAQDRFTGSRVCAYDRVKMLSGQPAAQQCFQLSANFFGVLPGDVDGATASLADASGNPNGAAAPPVGSPDYFLGLGRDSVSLNFWRFHVDWNTPAKSTFGTGAAHNPNATIAVAPFTLACNGSGQDCVPQPGAKNPEKLDTLGERLMFRLAYRRFGDHESLLASHSVDTGPPNQRTGVRWYELRDLTAASPTVFQQSTYAPDANHRWMSSVAMDKLGDISAGYNVSSSTVFPGIRYATRQPNDALNRLGPENTLQKGTGTQRCLLPNGQCQCPLFDAQGNPQPGCDTLTRWGDYSTLSIDPTDDCTFWFTSEYGEETGSFKWRTRISSFRLPSCH